jgi:hypothetical protein
MTFFYWCSFICQIPIISEICIARPESDPSIFLVRSCSFFLSLSIQERPLTQPNREIYDEKYIILFLTFASLVRDALTLSSRRQAVSPFLQPGNKVNLCRQQIFI